MERVDAYMKSKSIAYIVIIIGIITTIIPIIGSLLNGAINCDSAYYLSMVERIADGYVPYKTLHLGYTPLWFYINVFLKSIFGISYGQYEFYLFIHYCFQLGCAFFLYKIARCFSLSIIYSLFASWLFIIMTHWLQGNVILLEIPSVFFGLLGCWFALKYEKGIAFHYLWIGIISACSFLCKQFGFGFFFLTIYLMLISSQYQLKQKLFWFVLGYSLSIGCCFFLFGQEFISIIFSGYGTETAKSAGYDVSFMAKLLSIKNNLLYYIKRVVPMLILVFCFFLPIIRQKKWKHTIFCILGILGFSLQYYFVQGGWHYALYMTPFSVLFISILLSLRLSKIGRFICLFGCVVTVFLSVYSTYHNRVYKHYLNSREKMEQKNIGYLVEKNIPQGCSLWIVHGGIYYVYYLTNRMPPNIATIGYSFGPLGLSEEQGRKQAEVADFVLRFSKDYTFETFFTSDLKKQVEQHPFVMIQDSAILLHDCR